MSFDELWNALAAVIRQIPQSGLLTITLCALVCGWIGAVLIRRKWPFGRLISTASTLVLGGVLVMVVLQLSRFDPRLDVAIPEFGLPEQVVEGGVTRVPLSRDGHFWIEAEINGEPARFMVDTGATLTSISTDLAERAGVKPRDGAIPVVLQTANGAVSADLATIEVMEFGNISAIGLDTVIVPSLGTTNVMGMNLLSRLGSWGVEDNTLILTPRVEEEPSPER